MNNLWVYQLAAAAVPLAFVFAFGACVGSLVNVIAYRLPLGIGIVTPPSRCPSCETRLTFRENIPVFGWLILRGRCRFCRSPISPEYPTVEAISGLLFALAYALLFVLDPRLEVLGVPVGEIRPDWARAGVPLAWPTLAVWLVLLGSLVAMTITDLKTYTIPLVLTWTPAVVGVVVHPLHAAWVGAKTDGVGFWQAREVGGWSMPIPETLESPGVWGLWGSFGETLTAWPGVGVALGAAAGLALANILLRLGVFPRSFDDYDEWEQTASAEARASKAGATPATRSGNHPSEEAVDEPARASASGSDHEPTPQTGEGDPAMWLHYPHARREMLKEILFLAPIVMGGVLGARLIGSVAPATEPDLWLRVLAGSVTGYLVGGGVVWFVRVLGSLAFGKEAMGLGDVHVLAGIGACLGWIDAVLSFFAAVLVGLFAAAVLAGLSRDGKAPRMLAFGPYLAVGAVFVVVGKPLIELGLAMLMHRSDPLQLP